jgi:hypothetical protein
VTHYLISIYNPDDTHNHSLNDNQNQNQN